MVEESDRRPPVESPAIFSDAEAFLRGERLALLTWHGTFLHHDQVEDMLCHRVLDLATSAMPNLFLHGMAGEVAQDSELFFKKARTLPMAFPTVRATRISKALITLTCVECRLVD